MSHQQDDSHDWLGDAVESYVRYCFARDGFEVFGAGKWAADLIVRNTGLDEEKWWRVEVKSGHAPSLETMARKAELCAKVSIGENRIINFRLIKLKPEPSRGEECLIKKKGDVYNFLSPKVSQ